VVRVAVRVAVGVAVGLAVQVQAGISVDGVGAQRGGVLVRLRLGRMQVRVAP
jgi:hypothetical protein